jgi:hypothetical protein
MQHYEDGFIMWEFSLFQLPGLLAIGVLLFWSTKIRPGPRGGPPTHPIPVTSSVETSFVLQAPKEKPWETLIGFLRRRRSN